MSEAGISSEPPAKRALVFRLPGKESADNAHILMRALEKVGIPGELCPYWPDGEASWETETVLLEREIGSAPRLTAVEFRQRFGFELDLVELSLHQFATEPLTPELLLPESKWRQHLRGVAVLAAERMKASGADVVFVAHGAETVSRIIAEMAAHLGLRFLYWESGFFPGYVYVDPWAPHFFRGECWIDSQPLPDEPSPEAIAFLATWRKARLSKYAQTNKGLPPEVAAWATQDDRPILFLPGQVPTDANVVVNLGLHDNLSRLYENVFQCVPETWRILYKPHPKATIDPIFGNPLPPDRFMRAEIDIHDAFKLCAAVLTVSSNVGLEAIMAGTPTLVLGQPIYAGRDLTIDLPGPYALPSKLKKSIIMEGYQYHAVARLIDLIRNHALIEESTADQLRGMIVKASRAPPQPRMPYYPQVPPQIMELKQPRQYVSKYRSHDRWIRFISTLLSTPKKLD